MLSSFEVATIGPAQSAGLGRGCYKWAVRWHRVDVEMMRNCYLLSGLYQEFTHWEVLVLVQIRDDGGNSF